MPRCGREHRESVGESGGRLKVPARRYENGVERGSEVTKGHVSESQSPWMYPEVSLSPWLVRPSPINIRAYTVLISLT
jgi:hypothetical protein